MILLHAFTIFIVAHYGSLITYVIDYSYDTEILLHQKSIVQNTFLKSPPPTIIHFTQIFREIELSQTVVFQNGLNRIKRNSAIGICANALRHCFSCLHKLRDPSKLDNIFACLYLDEIVTNINMD